MEVLKKGSVPNPTWNDTCTMCKTEVRLGTEDLVRTGLGYRDAGYHEWACPTCRCTNTVHLDIPDRFLVHRLRGAL